jgi:hypothetical protein
MKRVARISLVPGEPRRPRPAPPADRVPLTNDLAVGVRLVASSWW